MEQVLRCDNCREELRPGDEPIRRGDRVYCCEACAFEASRSVDCEGRADSYAPSIVQVATQQTDFQGL
jgi:hypothetical protein